VMNQDASNIIRLEKSVSSIFKMHFNISSCSYLGKQTQIFCIFDQFALDYQFHHVLQLLSSRAESRAPYAGPLNIDSGVSAHKLQSERRLG
jgi:hypothetical protein